MRSLAGDSSVKIVLANDLAVDLIDVSVIKLIKS